MLTRRRTTQLPDDRPAPAAGQPHTPPAKQRSSVGGPPLSNGSSAQPLLGSMTPNLSCFLPRSTTNSIQDRSQEFGAVVKSMQMRQNFGILPTLPSHRSSKSEFTLIASKIGKDLASTLSKLEKLSLLTGKRSGDLQDTEQLTNVIRQDLGNLNKQIAQLQQFLKSPRSPTSRHGQMHANTVVVSLQSKLVAISTEFKVVLEQRNNEIKAESYQANRSVAKNSSYNDLQSDPSTADYPGSQVVINMDDGNMARQRQQQQQLMRRQVEQRTESMATVEQTIVELGGIFQQFAHMVKEQEEMIQRIDTHVEETNLNIDVAHSEIVKYFHTVSSNRNFMIKIFFVLIGFFVLFVYFVR